MAFQMLDDDDDFDWDAAVREIDFACINTSNSFSKIEINKPTAASRQSTLDKFIGFKSTNQDKVECCDEKLCSVSIDPEAAKTWIYPVSENTPVREYQESITRTALFSNTLVSLPTGLGKTLIAAVVMYNYFRWFPEGKIVFAAPSRPLVMQQIEACHNIVGIPQEWTVDLTGQTSPAKRADFWKAKRIFFVTPQVLEKDIQSGTCVVKQIVCLVIDEAHHASGNYSYCVAVRELMAAQVRFRILALTATPGSTPQAVQQVIDNLQISSLEYRSETDHDVTKYVSQRKIELIKVEMEKVTLEAQNLVIDVKRSLARKLSNMGVHLKRDVETLSPNDYLNTRGIYRQTPRNDLPDTKKNEIERIFAALITLCHMKRLLSAHGIRPAYEMLEDKLQAKGSLNIIYNGSGALQKARLLMRQNAQHGDNSPKFTKMLQVLHEHLNAETKDPHKSRVIIFSNYRESVSEILESLATIGDHVRATEFIGQSSGKRSKGQSQKAQQDVIKKFRDGVFNVIVSTSIGEEGLDIMEVDLVICFDANVSPLRMIQRMGRTGRKNEGRVVVLACEGPEFNGYLRKQKSGKTVLKHMINGGTNSFRFHSSPRMVPHVIKPEKRLVKLLIKEFVPRGKKVKDNDDDDVDIQTPKYKAKLTDAETELIAKYFDQNDWRPSLIAFPHFQAFPSRVHKISHSFRTRMLIDTMQCLQGLPFSDHIKSINEQDEETMEEGYGAESVEPYGRIIREDDTLRKADESNNLLTEEKHNIHSFLFGFGFGSDFISVDSLGNVVILSVPSFPLKQVSEPNSPKRLKLDLKDSPGVSLGLQEDDSVFQTEIPYLDLSKRDSDDESLLKAGDLSPRLTNLLMSGVVPESPINNGTSSKVKSSCIDMLPNSPIPLIQIKNNEESEDKTQTPQIEKGISASKVKGEIQTPLYDNSCSKDWILNSGESSVGRPKKRLKRLRKYGDTKSKDLLEKDPTSVSGRSCAHKHDRGGEKLLNDARVFIEDEAEVSSGASGDEDTAQEQDSYDGSFIDDRINPTSAECDMMAIYRRSLLTQTPIQKSSVVSMQDSESAAGNTNTDNKLCSSTSTMDGFSLSYCESAPIRNLDKEMSLNPEETAILEDDDDFFQGVDFDALEEQATKQLRSRFNQDLEDLGSPSFDLGI